MITSLNNVIEMDHPNLHKTHEYYNDSQFHYILSDFCSGGDLFPRILNMVPFTEKIASGIMKQLIGAVQGCHMNKTVHMDIKSDNILFSSPGSLIKIGDFGTNMGVGRALHYVAPEIINAHLCDEKVDVWSLGILMYILLTGQPPFKGTNKEII